MMRKSFRVSILTAIGVLSIGAPGLVAQRTPRPAPKPEPVNLKIRYKTTMAGQSSESTTMLKGSRERSEMKLGYGTDIINLTQCDLKRTVQYSDKTRKYLVTPMASGESTTPTPSTGSAVSTPVTRGGDITYIITSVDTGERKDMFGFKARHVKTTMSMNSSPDACSQVKQKIETDGWYIDLSFGLNCELGRSPMTAGRPASGGCRDRVHFRQEGTGRTGYPLSETTTMYGPDGNVMFTSSKEVIELSQAPLDAALFEVPAGYTETADSQELYGMPSMEQMMSQTGAGSQSSENPSSANNSSSMQPAKQPGMVRVGVVSINNRTDRQVSTESLRQQLISELQGNGIDAVSLNASSPSEANVEARAKQCDFILYSDVTALKTSAAKKIGGMFGRVAGVGGVDKTEAKIEFRLVAVGENAPRLQSSSTAKEEGDEASASTAISAEAKAVTSEVKKRRG